MYTLLTNVAVNVSYLNFYDEKSTFRFVLIGMVVAVALFAMYAVFNLAREIASSTTAICCALLMLVPHISFLGLMFVNQRAIKYFARYQIKCGFLGVDPNIIDSQARTSRFSSH